MHRALLILFLASAAFAEKRVVRPPAGPTSGPYSGGIATDQLFYVSGHVGPEPKGGFAPGDVKTQTRRCLELVGKVLKEAGLDYANVVSTTLYLTDIRTVNAADEAYREVFHDHYPARTEIESQLLIPEALVEVSAVAALGDARTIIYIRPDGWAEPKRPVSHAVFAGGTLFLSGLRPVDPATGKLAGDTIEAQTNQVMRNQEALLAAMKMKPADVVSSRIYVTDPTYFAPLNAVFRKAIPSAPPARAAIRMEPAEPGHLLQIQAVAVRGAGDGRATGDGFSAKAGKALYLSGITGRTPDGKYARNDIKAQTRQTLLSIEEQLKRNGMTFADLVDAVVWIRDPRHAAAMNEVYREMVKPNPPARATVRLAPMNADGLVEIMMIASK